MANPWVVLLIRVSLRKDKLSLCGTGYEPRPRQAQGGAAAGFTGPARARLAWDRGATTPWLGTAPSHAQHRAETQGMAGLESPAGPQTTESWGSSTKGSSLPRVGKSELGRSWPPSPGLATATLSWRLPLQQASLQQGRPGSEEGSLGDGQCGERAIKVRLAPRPRQTRRVNDR